MNIPFLIPLLVLSQFGNGSVFSLKGDKYNPENQPLACESILIKRHGRSSFKKMMYYGVAHRTIPCGTELKLCVDKKNNFKCSKAYVIDRGPYGVVYQHKKKKRWRMFRKLPRGKRYRGIVDVLSPLASRLRVSGIFQAFIFMNKNKIY